MVFHTDSKVFESIPDKAYGFLALIDLPFIAK